MGAWFAAGYAGKFRLHVRRDENFLDRTYYPAQGKIGGLLYAVFISAGNDGSGALTSIERIARGYPLKPVCDPIVARGELTAEVLRQCEELGETMASGVTWGFSEEMAARVGRPLQVDRPAAETRPVGSNRGGIWRVAWGFVLISLALVLLLRWMPPPISSIMAQDWLRAVWSDGATIRHQWMPYEKISPHAALAVIAGEDQRFPEHYGFDWIEIRQVLDDLEAGKSARGASTLSQQVAKNLFLWSGRDWVRKVGSVVYDIAGVTLVQATDSGSLFEHRRVRRIYLRAEAASRRFLTNPPPN